MVADYDVEKAEMNCFIDEIDKIARKSDNPSITRDISGEGFNGLFKTFRRKYCKCSTSRRRETSDQKYIQVNTQNILFIAGGAFDGIKEIIERRLNKQAIGLVQIKHSKVRGRKAIF